MRWIAVVVLVACLGWVGRAQQANSPQATLSVSYMGNVAFVTVDGAAWMRWVIYAAPSVQYGTDFLCWGIWDLPYLGVIEVARGITDASGRGQFAYALQPGEVVNVGVQAIVEDLVMSSCVWTLTAAEVVTLP